jgi:hypothetical protein
MGKTSSGYLDILSLTFYADTLTAKLVSSHGGRAAADEWVKDGITFARE